MKRTTSLTIALALATTLGLSACADEDTTSAGVSPDATESVVSGDDDADATDDSDDADSADASDDSDDADTADDSGPAAVPAPADDLTAAALAAIATAQEETGGTAYEIDDEDEDGTWKVDVRVGDRSVEVTVSADGASVVGTEEDDLDSEDAAGLDAATITLTEAVETAVAEVGGVLDDAELDEEDGTHAWKITVDGADAGDDVEVLVSVTGEVLRTDA